MKRACSRVASRPSLGAWAAYGLGSENRNMPAFVVMPDPHGWVKGGAPAWSNGFLPATYQGTLFRPAGDPGVSRRAQHLWVARRAPQRVHDRVLAASGSDDENSLRLSQ